MDFLKFGNFMNKSCVDVQYLECSRTTNDGRVMAISKILYGQYHICVRPENQKFYSRKYNQIHFPMDKGLTVSK